MSKGRDEQREKLIDIEDDPVGAEGLDAPSDQEVQEMEKRLMSGDMPEDFLNVTEPKTGDEAAPKTNVSFAAANPTASLSKFPGTSGTAAESGDRPTETSVPSVPSVPSDSSGTEHRSETPDATAESRPMTTEEKDHALALAMQKQLDLEEQERGTAEAFHRGGLLPSRPPANAIGKLTFSVVEARLVRNYGLTKMDPYCRIRIGHCVTETLPCSRGGCEPKWNATFNCYLLSGVDHIDLEIYDRCTFQADALIAHGHLPIPAGVTQKGLVVDEWWPLSGQEGHHSEGQIHLVLSMQPVTRGGGGGRAGSAPVMVQMMPGERKVITLPATPGPVPEGQTVTEPQPPTIPKLTEEQLDEFSKMFPNIDREVIVSVYQENLGNQESTVNSLLLLGSDG